MLSLHPSRYVFVRRRDVFISIQGMGLESIGMANVKLDSGVTVTFVVAKGLVHEAVRGMDILGDATLDLAHGLAVIPKLAFDGQLETGGLGGEQTAAEEDLQILLDIVRTYLDHIGTKGVRCPLWKQDERSGQDCPRPSQTLVSKGGRNS